MERLKKVTLRVYEKCYKGDEPQIDPKKFDPVACQYCTLYWICLICRGKGEVDGLL